MKGLIFNLLDSMARKSGCADEAWDLVMEFVASETEHDAESDTCLSCFGNEETWPAFETPAEAMIQCLTGDSLGMGESLSEFPEMALAHESEERTSDSIPALMDPEYCARAGISSPEGFSHDLLGLLEQLLAEALSGNADVDDGDSDRDEAPLSARSLRRQSS